MILTMFGRFTGTLLDIIFPNKCASCKARIPSTAEEHICSDCLKSIKRNLPPFCHSCGRRLMKGTLTKNICPECLKTKLHFDRAFSPCIYTGVVKNVIHEFKYKNKDYLGKTLSRLVIEFIKEYNLPMDAIDYILPIPLNPARMREREFNQAENLGRHIATEFNKQMLCDILIRNRYTQTQTSLEKDKRFSNVKGSFSLKQTADLKRKNLLLIDDVLTSGATTSEAALTLKTAGAGIVFVLTVAN